MKRYTLAFFLIVATIKLYGQDNESSKGMCNTLNIITQSIANGDVKTLASYCTYPIYRQYPLRSIENKQQMMDNFNIIFDDSIRQVLKTTKCDDWNNWGWRGYYCPNYIIWCNDGGLYKIDYMSSKESKLLFELVKKEINSLHPTLQGEEWTPYACFRDKTTGDIMRVDVMFESNPYTFRLSIYNKDQHPSDYPSCCMIGNREIQGSGLYEYFTFSALSITYSFIYNDSWGIEVGSLDVIEGEGDNAKIIEEHKMELFYWSDFKKF